MELKNRLLRSNEEIYKINQDLLKTVGDIYELALAKYQLRLSEISGREGERLMHKQEVINYLKISLRTYYRLKTQKLLVPILIGKTDYYYESDLQTLLVQRKNKGRY